MAAGRQNGAQTALTEINPELREQTLGRVEKIDWAGGNAVRNWGYLIYPVGYEPARATHA